MKLNFKRCLSMFLVVAMVFALSAIPTFADFTGAKLTGEDVIVENGTATVDVKINFATKNVTNFDMLAFAPKADAGLTLSAVTIPEAYTNDADTALDNVTTAGKEKVYFANDYKDDMVIAAAASADIVLKYTIDDPTVAKTYNITIADAEVMFDMGASMDITVAKNASVTVKAAEVPVPEVEVTWDYATDAVLGGMRWLFDATVENGTLEETKVRFVKGNNIEAEIAGVEMSGTAATFAGDIENVPEDAAGTYYAVGFAKVNGVWYPSEVLANSPYAAN